MQIEPTSGEVETTTEAAKPPEAKKKVVKKKVAAKKKAVKKKVAKKKVAAKKTIAQAKPKFGSDLRISKIGENPRAKGSAAYKRFESMRKYMTKNPRATVAEMLAGSDYLRVGFEKDRERGAFKVSSV